MNNLQRMKQNIIHQIESMDAEKFYEFVYCLPCERNNPDCIIDLTEIFRCFDCEEKYGVCDEGKECIERFVKYCSEEENDDNRR